MTEVVTLTLPIHDAGEKGGELIPKLVRPGALKNEDQRRALRDQAGKLKPGVPKQGPCMLQKGTPVQALISAWPRGTVYSANSGGFVQE